MASYFLRSRHISRGKGARVTRAAAYRAGERIRDERTSEAHNYSSRADVVHKEIVLPSQLAEREDMGWARDRSTLWNAAEHAGLRRDSRLARELLVLLPPELTPARRIHLVQRFARELADKYGGAVDCAIHEPRPGADQRNHHAHLLMTTREVTPQGLGRRTALELGGREAYLRGLGPTKAEYLLIRERWAQMTNEALRDAGSEARIDHRSLKDQGIDREPTPTIPEKVFYAEKRSGHSAAGDAIRARYRERLEARQRGGDALERVLQKQARERRQHALEDLRRKEHEPKAIRWSALTREERNQRRREQYAARRGRGSRKLRAQSRAALRDRLPSAAVAAESARQWALYRETHPPGPTAAESARNWRALEENRKANPGAQARTAQPTPSRPAGAGRTQNRCPGEDHGL